MCRLRMQLGRLGQQQQRVSLGQVQTIYGTLSAMHALRLDRSLLHLWQLTCADM